MEQIHDLSSLLQACSEFGSYPGQHNDASVKEFLDTYPLPLIFSALSLKGDVPEVESSMLSCLEMVFKTKYGISQVPQYMSFVCMGLNAESPALRRLACETVAIFLENNGVYGGEAAELIVSCGAYPLLMTCLLYGDERISASSMKALIELAKTSSGLEIFFPANDDDRALVNILSQQRSPLARTRVFSLTANLFSTSSAAASAVRSSGLLDLLVADVKSSSDVLMTLSVLEVLYELASSQHGTECLLSTTLLQLLTSLIRTSVESVLKSRAIVILGRLLSCDNMFTIIEKTYTENALSAISEILEHSENEDSDECISAIDAIGQIGASFKGAELLFASAPLMVEHVTKTAFLRKGRGAQLAALHSLGSIVGEDRSTDKMLLTHPSEEHLRQLIYETAAVSSKLSPSGLLHSLLQQDAEIRLAAYRVIAGLVMRPWCLLEVCLKREFVDIITDAYSETTKYGMEARHKCCLALMNAIAAQPNPDDALLSAAGSKVQEAVRRGPYLGNRRSEPQPVVVPAERF